MTLVHFCSPSLSLAGCSDYIKLERFLSCPSIMTKETICLVTECGKYQVRDENMNTVLIKLSKEQPGCANYV